MLTRVADESKSVHTPLLSILPVTYTTFPTDFMPNRIQQVTIIHVSNEHRAKSHFGVPKFSKVSL